MKLLTLEKRPTSPAKLAKLTMGAVFAAVTIAMFVAPLIVRHDYGSLSSGERVSTVYGGFGFIESVDVERGVVVIRQDDAKGRLVEVPLDQVTEL